MMYAVIYRDIVLGTRWRVDNCYRWRWLAKRAASKAVGKPGRQAAVVRSNELRLGGIPEFLKHYGDMYIPS